MHKHVYVITYVYNHTCISLDNEIPLERNFTRILVGHCNHWWDIGLQLGLKPAVLGTIKANHDTQEERFKMTLKKWLDLNSKGTWADLEFAITNVNRASLALDELCWSDWRLAIIKNFNPQQIPSGE